MLKQISGFALGPIVAAIIGLVAVPILTRLIVPDIYAQFSLAQVTIQLLSLAVLIGLDQGYLREFYEVKSKQTLLLYTLGINVGMACVVSVLLLLMYESVSTFLFAEADYDAVVMITLTVVGLMFLRYVMLYLRMEGRSFSYSAVLIVQSSTNIVFVLLLLYYHVCSPLYALLLASMLSTFLATLMGAYQMRIKWSVQLSTSFDSELFRQLLRFSLPLMVSTLLMWILYSADQYMLRLYSDFTQLGIYAVSYKLCAALMLFQVITSTVWAPLSLRWAKEGKSIDIFNRVGFAMASTLTVVFLLLIALKDYIILLLGSEYRDAIAVFPYLLLFPIYYTLAEVASVGISISRKTRVLMLVTFVCSVINIGLNYYAIPIWGAKGAAAVTAVTFVIYFHLRFYFSNIYWKRVSLQPYLYAGVTYGLILFLSEMYDVTYLCYLLLTAWVVVFVRREKEFLHDLYVSGRI